jgi:alpha-beta hydrolase superfamily lysophospholipase
MEKNPLELRTASARLLINTLLEQGRCVSALPQIRCAVLFLLAGRDYLVDPQAARRAFQRLVPTDKQLIDYPDMLHALSIDLGRERVFKDLAAWLKGHA